MKCHDNIEIALENLDRALDNPTLFEGWDEVPEELLFQARKALADLEGRKGEDMAEWAHRLAVQAANSP